MLVLIETFWCFQTNLCFCFVNSRSLSISSVGHRFITAFPRAKARQARTRRSAPSLSLLGAQCFITCSHVQYLMENKLCTTEG